MPDEPETLMLQLLRDMRAGNQRYARKHGYEGRCRGSRKRDALFACRRASDFIATRKEFNEKTVGPRCALVEYQTTVIGHGVLISELEARLRRVERHLNLDAPDAR